MRIIPKLRSLFSKLQRKPKRAPPWRPKNDAECFHWLCSAAVVLMRAGILYDREARSILDKPRMTAQEAARLADLLGPFHTWLHDRQNDEPVRVMMLCSPENLLAAAETVAKELRQHYVEKIPKDCPPAPG
jgi:hypothetical protein